MTLFDRYIAVDWSAESKRKTGKDSIWIGESHRGIVRSTNAPTRHEAMSDIALRLTRAIAAGERVLIGFDFAFGYPTGAARHLAGYDDWQAIWSLLHTEIEDNELNVSNRFEAAGRINGRLPDGAARYWGHPWQHRDRYPGLTPRRPDNNHSVVAEKRQVERLSGKAQAVWKLSGAGAVGSQSLVGIPHLQTLRENPELKSNVAIWPFETAFANDLSKQIVVAEIFPSIIEIAATTGVVRDQLQVEAIARLLADADREGALAELLSQPDRQDIEWQSVLSEEGWIVGVGHEHLVASLSEIR